MFKSKSVSPLQLIKTDTMLSPEFRLAVEVSWLSPDKSRDWHCARVDKCCQAIGDWGDFVKLVDRHRMPVFAYLNLVQHADKVPADILELLKERTNTAKFQALRHAAELQKLCRRFNDQRIPCITLKGQVLSHQLYGDPGIRQSKDIDLLVLPQDLERIDQLLLKDGFSLADPYHDLTSAQADFLFAAFHHHEYHHQERGVSLELHWRFLYWHEKQMQQFWDTSRFDIFAGIDVRVLSDDLQFLYLCDHGSIHKWFRLKWLGDIARIIADDRIASWEQLVKQAEQLDLHRGVGQAALLVAELYGIDLPKPLLMLAQKTESHILARDALEQILLSTADILNSGKRAEGLRMFFYMQRLRPKLPLMTLLRRTLICQQDYQLVRLPDSLFWLYFPLRPFFWLWRNFVRRRSQ